MTDMRSYPETDPDVEATPETERAAFEALGGDVPLEEIKAILAGRSALPVDCGLEVVVRPVPGDSFDDSHVHHEDGAIVCHLNAAEAELYDRHFNRFFVAWLNEVGDVEVQR